MARHGSFGALHMKTLVLAPQAVFLAVLLRQIVDSSLKAAFSCFSESSSSSESASLFFTSTPFHVLKIAF